MMSGNQREPIAVPDCADSARRGTAVANQFDLTIPVGVGSTGKITLDDDEMTAMLAGGARWAVERGYGRPEDLERIEENGRQDDAKPSAVSAQARKRQRREMGTLGSGNHYLEVQEVVEIFDADTAAAFGPTERSG